jgi:hypothetical protein
MCGHYTQQKYIILQNFKTICFREANAENVLQFLGETAGREKAAFSAVQDYVRGFGMRQHPTLPAESRPCTISKNALPIFTAILEH